MTGLARTARAFVTYSLVPYLGIVFCPRAVLLGTIGVVRSYRTQQVIDRGACYTSTIAGLIVLMVQLLLWWVLYQCRSGPTNFDSSQRSQEEFMRTIFTLLLLEALLTGAFAQHPRTMDPEPANAPAPQPAPKTVKANYEGGVFGCTKTMKALIFDDENSRLVFKNKPTFIRRSLLKDLDIAA